MIENNHPTASKIARKQPLNPQVVRHLLARLAPHIPERLRQEPAQDADIPFVPRVFEDLDDIVETLEHCISMQHFFIEASCSLLGQSSLTTLTRQASAAGAENKPSAFNARTQEQRHPVPCAYWQVGFQLSLMAFQSQLEHILWRIEEFLDYVLHTQRFVHLAE